MPILGVRRQRTGGPRCSDAMKYSSTRRSSATVGLQVALEEGLAPDGGLYMPEKMPGFCGKDFDGCVSGADVAGCLLQPFFVESAIEAKLPEIAQSTFSFPLPLVPLGGENNAQVLELFHGPTAAFKDFGARFLASSLQHLSVNQDGVRTILVATSGDTGGAVAAAFHGKPGFRVVVLFPHERVSRRQVKQLACWGGNVQALAVTGTFDDCQRLVKEAFAASVSKPLWRLGSANSINIGRLLPQCAYYAWASLRIWRETGKLAGFVIPAGNMGNALACIMARAMGLPVGPIVLATNANRAIGDYLQNGRYDPRPAIETLATAMDVGDPSNMERFRYLEQCAQLGDAGISVFSADDDAISQQIVTDFQDYGRVHCPHTATATYAWQHLPKATRSERPWVLVSTAHAAKFETTVEPLIGQSIELPPSLAELENREAQYSIIGSSFAELCEVLSTGDT